jgi:hypothetical protein
LAKSEGIEIGIGEGVLRTARNALKEGADVPFVMKITGLDEATINKLRTELLN